MELFRDKGWRAIPAPARALTPSWPQLSHDRAAGRGGHRPDRPKSPGCPAPPRAGDLLTARLAGLPASSRPRSRRAGSIATGSTRCATSARPGALRLGAGRRGDSRWLRYIGKPIFMCMGALADRHTFGLPAIRWTAATAPRPGLRPACARARRDPEATGDHQLPREMTPEDMEDIAGRCARSPRLSCRARTRAAPALTLGTAF